MKLKNLRRKNMLRNQSTWKSQMMMFTTLGSYFSKSLVGPDASENKEAFMLNAMASFSNQDGRRKIVDPIVLNTSSQESLSIVISISNKCISNRPLFEDVLWNLQYAAQVQATADADQKSDSVT